MHPLVTIAVRAARNAGDFLQRSSVHLDEVRIESKSPDDYVSAVDRGAEERIIATILDAYPDHAILAEESGKQGDSEFVWHIDPLDGTTNYLHGYPHYCVSIALIQGKKLECGVIYDPCRNELYTAKRGHGAQMNGRRIRTSNRKALPGAILATGFPIRRKQLLEPYLETFKVLFLPSSGIRRSGSAALDLAFVASGRVDGFWEYGLSSWDIAAGILLVQEAGGLVSDTSGGLDFLETGNVAAANPRILREMVKRIAPLSARMDATADA